MNVRTPARLGAAVLCGTALAAALPAFAAVSASSPPAGVAISIDGTGHVTSRGAAVTVPLTITCPADSYTWVYASISERVGNGVASASASRQIHCTNVPERVDFQFQAQSGGKAFKAGTANVNATLTSYSRNGYVELQVDGPVKLSGR